MEPSLEILATLPMWLVAFLFSTTCHEAAHALIAKLGGDLTAYHGGQVTLDPIPHIRRSPMGMIVVPIVSYLLNGWMLGWASAPLDPFWAARHPKRAALVSAAGPAANLIIMLVAAAAIHIGMAAGAFSAPRYASFAHVVVAADGTKTAFTMFLGILFSLNLMLALFNLVPLPPLDGNKVITLLFSDRTTQKWNELFDEPSFRILGLVAAWFLFGKVFHPIHVFAIHALHPGIYG
jgi:Zn-dependent protease